MALAFLAPSAWAGDWIVDDDGGPGVDFSDIQSAIQVAAPGDTILVRAGSYGPFVIDAKAITLTREGTGSVLVTGTSEVRNITAPAAVQLDGIEMERGRPALHLENNAGPVWLSDCLVREFTADYNFWGDMALDCDNSADVGMIRCTVIGERGGDGFDIGFSDDGGRGGNAIRATTSTLRLYDCTLEGGSGGNAYQSEDEPGAGAAALQLASGSQAFISTSELSGGLHGSPYTGCAAPLTSYSNSTARHFRSLFSASDCTLQPPVGLPESDTTAFCFGTPNACPCCNGGSGGAGCSNSYGHGGGQLYLTGNASVSADTITLRHAGLSSGKPLLYFQGTLGVANGLGAPLGDGLLCAGASIIRLATRLSSGGEDAYGFSVASDPLISVRGQVPAIGATRFYQVWYRDPAAACGAGNFNLSNGLLVPWKP